MLTTIQPPTFPGYDYASIASASISIMSLNEVICGPESVHPRPPADRCMFDRNMRCPKIIIAISGRYHLVCSPCLDP